MSIDHLFDTTKDNVHMVKIDQYEADPIPIATKRVSTATSKQLSYLKDLFEQRKNNEEAMILREHLLGEYRAGKLTIRMASDAIEDVKTIPKDTVSPQSTLPIAANHGEIWVTTGGRFVRVKESQNTGNLYGLVWDGREWNYDLGRQWNVMNILDHKITAEEAAAWGHEHQWCVFCSRPLSDPRSEFAGYGETCARKHMLPWGDVAERPEPVISDEAWQMAELAVTLRDAEIKQPTKEEEDVYENPYGDGICRICLQPRPYVLNGYLRGCNC